MTQQPPDRPPPIEPLPEAELHQRELKRDQEMVDALFSEMFTNLKNMPSGEVKVALQTSPDPKELRVLFDEVAEALSPRRAKEQQATLLSSENRKIEASQIAQKATATAKIVRVIETERRKKAAAERALRLEQLADQRILLQPPLLDRLGAAIVDLLAICLISTALGLLVSCCIWPARILDILSGGADDLAIVLALSAIVGVLPVVSIAYNLFCFLVKKKTFGMTFSNLTITDRMGNRAPGFNLVVRSLATPASFLLLGFVAPLLGRRSFADILANTRFIQEYSSLEDSEDTSPQATPANLQN